MTYDAIVIGGGPAGATTGLVLARAGWRVAIIEKSRFPRRKVCGEFMSTTNAPLFDELGLNGLMAQAGPEIRQVGLFARETIVSAPMPRGARAGGWGRAIGRDRLDDALLKEAAAAGADIWQPWQATDLQRTGDAHRLTIESRNECRHFEAPIVIAAHGSWDTGRLQTQPKRAHRASDLLAFKAHLTGSRLSPEMMPLLVFPGGYGGMVQSDAGRVSITCCIRRDVLQRRRRSGAANAAQAVLDHVRESCRGVREALDGTILDGHWLAAGPIRPGIRPRYADGIFRVGNAAGEAHPIIAEGISMAMQSGWLLGQRLVAHAPRTLGREQLDALGAAYGAEWRAQFGTRIRAASGFAHLAMRDASVGLLLPIVERFPALLTWGAALSGKIKAVPDPGRRPSSIQAVGASD